MGRSGSGKTGFVIEKVEKLAQKNRKVLFIVPEQFTVSSERAVLKFCGSESLKFIEVLNFRRLSDKVFRETGTVRGRYLDDGGRNVLMAKALETVSDYLSAYKNVTSPEFISRLIDVSDELKYYCVDAEELKEKSEQIENPLRKGRFSDIALVLSAYDALVKEGFSDTMSDLDVLADKIPMYKDLKEQTVIFDAFHTFTPQEYKVIFNIIKNAKAVYFTLCTDSLEDKDAGFGLLSNVKATGVKLKDFALTNGIEYIEPVILNKPERFNSEALMHLESNIFETNSVPFKDKTDNVCIYSAKDAFDEAEYIAAKISRLVRTGSYNYRDFIVIGRGVEEYRGILDALFSRYDIPCFDDRRSELLTKPLMLLVMAALNIAVYGYETENVLTYLKSGLAGIDDEDICLLENYIYMWNINKFKWTDDKDWRYNPDGFEKELSDEAKELLNNINNVKKRVKRSIDDFINSTKNTNGEDISKYLYKLLIDLNVPSQLKKQAEKYKSNSESSLSQEQEQVWDIFIKALDQTALVLKDTKLTMKRYKELFELVLSKYTIGKIPTSLDEVVIGNADRVRPYNPRCVFLIGVNDGVFPKVFKDDGIITDADREEMNSLGLFLAPSTSDKAFEERFFAYLALSCASEKVYISYVKTGLDGREARPSYLVNTVKKMLPNCNVKDFSDINLLNKTERIKPSFDLLCAYSEDKTDLISALKSYYGSKEEYAQKLTRALRVKNFTKDERLNSKDTIKSLYGTNLRLSPSKADSYFNCKFQYFCKYALNARQRKRAELAAPEVGTFIHHALEYAIKEAVNSGKNIASLSESELKALASKISHTYLEEYMGGEEKSARFMYLYRRLVTTVSALLINISKEFAQSGFVPCEFELPISAEKGVKPITINLENGGSVVLTGYVDRVDVFEKNDIKYIRIVDYKTGSKTFSLIDVYNGLNLQMLIYLFSIWENGEERFNAKVMPAGILYYPAYTGLMRLTRNVTEGEAKEEREKQYKMNGLLLNDIDCLSAMERELQGRFIPVKAKKDGFISSTSVASLAQFGHLKSYIEKLLCDMGKELCKGQIDIDPFKDSKLNSCRYCEMKPICGYEPGRGRAKRYKKIKVSELYSLLEGEADNGR